MTVSLLEDCSRIRVNGVPKNIPFRASLAWLLQDMSLSGKRVAVELNGCVVPRLRYAEVLLREGDALEVVMAVSGG